MFFDSLYTIRGISGAEGQLTFEINLNGDHPLYSGHFPGHPVTPGVVLAEVVKELLEHYVQTDLRMVSMRQCKFLIAHNPREVPDMVISLAWTKDEEYVVQADGTAGLSTFFKLSATYRPLRASL